MLTFHNAVRVYKIINNISSSSFAMDVINHSGRNVHRLLFSELTMVNSRSCTGAQSFGTDC